MVEKIGVAEARRNLSDLLNRVAYGGETFVIAARGKPTAPPPKPVHKGNPKSKPVHKGKPAK